jgi:hypothetical protein
MSGPRPGRPVCAPVIVESRRSSDFGRGAAADALSSIQSNRASNGVTVPFREMRNFMRILLPVILSIAASSSAALAQNSDIGVLFGVSAPVTTVGAGHVSSSVGGSFELNYAAQIHESKAGQLYVELPFFVNVLTDEHVGSGSVVSGVKDSLFFTPGVRYRFTPAARVSFYAVAGGGLASFGRLVQVVGPGVVNVNSRSTTGAMDFGGGLDFRLTRLLSLRFEGRDAVTSSKYDGAAHHTFFVFGVGFHF